MSTESPAGQQQNYAEEPEVGRHSQLDELLNYIQLKPDAAGQPFTKHSVVVAASRDQDRRHLTGLLKAAFNRQ